MAVCCFVVDWLFGLRDLVVLSYFYCCLCFWVVSSIVLLGRLIVGGLDLLWVAFVAVVSC